jgi:hypothetical protein
VSEQPPVPVHPSRRLCPLVTVVALLCAALPAGCPRPPTAVTPDPGGAAIAPPAGPDFFQDMTLGSGVDFTYRNGEEAGHFAILESLGGGVALLDYDGDGLLDVFVTGGGGFDRTAEEFARDPSRPPRIRGAPSKLYRNLGGWKFQDVTAAAGLDQPLVYSHGCAVADYDRDGWPDLLVTGWDRLVLYHNEPDGKGGRRFVDVTQRAGLTESLWSTSAAWGDLDGDGYPDLYVCHYLDWSFRRHPSCPGERPSVPRDVCAPSNFKALPHRLYRNNGNGTFTDVSAAAGLRHGTSADGRGLGVLLADVNADGRPDVYAVNDQEDNLLYVNRSSPGRLRFEEKGVESGVARDDQGSATGSMGVDAADYDGSGRPSLWVTNFEMERHALYRNEGAGSFVYRSQLAGVAALGEHYVGFGTGFLDLDGDGWEDLVVVNGHVLRYPGRNPRRQRPVLLRNEGNGRFREVSAAGGPYFRTDHLGRGLAVGDLDNDGQADLVVSHLNEPVVLLRGRSPLAGASGLSAPLARASGLSATPDAGRHWLGVQLVGKGHRDVVGARVEVEVGGRRLTRFAKGGGSYLSSGDRRLLFGLGPARQVALLRVVWPWGQEQSWQGLAVDRYWRLVEGEPAAR